MTEVTLPVGTFKTLTFKDFPNICRICLYRGDDLENLIDLNLTNLYKLLTNIEIKDEDVLPKNICSNCKTHLGNINSLIEKCKNNEFLLKEISLQGENTYEIYDLDNCGFEQNEESLNEVLIVGQKNDKLLKSVGVPKISFKGRLIGHNCPICREYIDGGTRKNHYRLSPKCRPDGYKCSECEKSFYPKYKLLTHLRSHVKEKLYECSECCKKFSFAENLRKHALTHKEVKPFVCDICEKGFLRKRSLDEHMNFHTGRTPYICVYCGIGFKRFADHAAHVYRKHNEDLEKIPKHKRKYTEKRVHLKLECETCGKVLASRSGFANHQLIHQGIKRFLCNICGRKFIANAALQIHMRSHTNEKPFGCKHCGKHFSLKTTLNIHMSRHLKDHSLPCPHCDKKYYTKNALNNHIFTHANDKPLECPYCNEQFNQENTFQSHIQQHTSKRYNCSLCNKSFTARCNLKVHMRTHTGEKPYVCSVCGKKLAHPQTLKVHMRQHTGETPYVCSVCEKGFHDSSNLRRHFNRVHGGENGAKQKSG